MTYLKRPCTQPTGHHSRTLSALRRVASAPPFFLCLTASSLGVGSMCCRWRRFILVSVHFDLIGHMYLFGPLAPCKQRNSKGIMCLHPSLVSSSWVGRCTFGEQRGSIHDTKERESKQGGFIYLRLDIQGDPDVYNSAPNINKGIHGRLVFRRMSDTIEKITRGPSYSLVLVSHPEKPVHLHASKQTAAVQFGGSWGYWCSPQRAAR